MNHLLSRRLRLLFLKRRRVMWKCQPPDLLRADEIRSSLGGPSCRKLPTVYPVADRARALAEALCHLWHGQRFAFLIRFYLQSSSRSPVCHPCAAFRGYSARYCVKGVYSPVRHLRASAALPAAFAGVLCVSPAAVWAYHYITTFSVNVKQLYLTGAYLFVFPAPRSPLCGLIRSLIHADR